MLKKMDPKKLGEIEDQYLEYLRAPKITVTCKKPFDDCVETTADSIKRQ